MDTNQNTAAMRRHNAISTFLTIGTIILFNAVTNVSAAIRLPRVF